MQAEKDELPVIGWLCETQNGRSRVELVGCLADADAAWGFKRTPLTDHATATSKLAELQREVEGLRKDAERWRFYDKHANDWIEDHQLGLWLQRPGLWKHGSRNAAIDAAMQMRPLPSSTEG